MNTPNQAHIFVTIEGVDGTGKSTVAKMLAELIGAAHIITPSPSLHKQRELVEKTNDRAQKFDFYTRAIIQQQEEIKYLLTKSNVVCDRYIHSTFAYQWPTDKTMPSQINGFFKEIELPNYSFLLTVNEKSRAVRIKNREETTGIINTADHRHDIIDMARDRFMKMKELTQVDTSEKTPEEVCHFILRLINIASLVN